MKLREKIIVVLTVLAGIYGLADYFLLSGNSGSEEAALEKGVSDLNTYGAEVKARLAVLKLDDPDRRDYLVSKAESQWTRDPFGADAGVDDSTGQGYKFVYSGFIRAGNVILAVVNGIEYRVGEMLREVGYKVAGITPSQVILLTESNEEIVVYLVES